jgi:hypothetical protein
MICRLNRVEWGVSRGVRTGFLPQDRMEEIKENWWETVVLGCRLILKYKAPRYQKHHPVAKLIPPTGNKYKIYYRFILKNKLSWKTKTDIKRVADQKLH